MRVLVPENGNSHCSCLLRSPCSLQQPHRAVPQELGLNSVLERPLHVPVTVVFVAQASGGSVTPVNIVGFVILSRLALLMALSVASRLDGAILGRIAGLACHSRLVSQMERRVPKTVLASIS
jgi:hypothetical protein